MLKNAKSIERKKIVKSLSHLPGYLLWRQLVLSFGEGNGNPLQCSCLENPRDGGAWWAAVSGVAQSQTRLKRLSSSSSNDGTQALKNISENSPSDWMIAMLRVEGSD